MKFMGKFKEFKNFGVPFTVTMVPPFKSCKQWKDAENVIISTKTLFLCFYVLYDSSRSTQ